MMLKKILRLHYSKIGMSKYIGHLDVVRLMTRAITRSSIPVLYSQGFSPHMKLSFGPSLPLGVTSECEFLDVAMNEAESFGTLDVWRNELESFLPEGIRIIGIRILEENSQSLSQAIDCALYEIIIPQQFAPENGKLARFLQMEKIEVEKTSKQGTTIIDIRQSIKRMNRIDTIQSNDRVLVYQLEISIGQSSYATPALVIKSLLECDWQNVPGLRIHRKALYSSTGSL